VNSYLDTSALVKLVIVERDTDVVTTLWSRVDDPYSSLLGYAEMRAAVASAIRAGRVPAFDDAAVRQTLDGVWRHMIGVEVDDRVVRAAGDLADRHGLRAAHAIHLASAIRILEADTAFITFDARLREAAAAEGFMVLPETV
jgi:hypothetical protein